MKLGSEAGEPADPGSAWGMAAAPAPGGDALATPESSRYADAGLVGQGGMGSVHAAHDRRLGREVAIKRAASHLPAARADALLAHEARVLARLDHPNIVPLHDAGRDTSGAPWFAMRLVRGQTLADALATPWGPSELPRLLRHLLDAARALAHAHERGVVHADLKPANLLLGPYGETQVADWGLARWLDPALPAPPLGQGAGTPPWRAPEVEAGEMPGPAADVYALGVLLGQLLGPPEAAPVELLAVVRRATATLPADRYPSAAALADDLAAWLDGRPVLAHAYSPRELLARSLRAWRRPLLGLAAVLVAAGTVAGVAAARLAAERDRAVAAEVEARATAARLWSDRATAALRRDDRPEAVRAAREALALVPDPHARGALAAFPTAGSEAPAEAWPLPPCALGLRFAADGLGCLERDGVHLLDLRGAPQGHLALAASDVIAHGDGWRAITAEGVVAWDGPQGPHRPLGLRASRTGLVAGTPGGVVDRLRLHLLTDPPREVSPCPSSENLDTVVFGDGGRWWGVCSGGVAVRGEADGAWAPLGPAQPGLQRVVALALDGEEVLAGTLDGALVRFHADSGLVLGRQRTGLGAIARLAVAPGGGRVLAVDEAGAAWVGVPRAGASEGRLPVAGVRDARWATDRAALLATGSRLERWELGPSLVDAWQEPGGVSALAIAPAGDRVAVAVGPLLHVRRIEDGALLGRSELHGRVIKGVAWSPEGDRLATGAVDEGFGVAWARADASAHTYEASSEHRARSLDVDGEGRVFVTLWSLRFLSAPAVGAPLQSYPLPRMLTQLVGVPTGAGAWGLDEQGALWFVGTDLEPRPVPEVGGPARALALSGDGRRLAVAQDGHVAVYALDPVRLRARWPWEGELTALALDHTGARVALGDIHGAVQERTEEGALSWTAPGHTERVSALRATADGGWLSAGWDGRVRRWRGP